MLARVEPCGECRCCEAGVTCAHVLVLDAKQEAQLRRIEQTLGGVPTGRHISLAVKPSAEARREATEELRIAVECPQCGGDQLLPSWLAEWAQKHRGVPKCEDCKAAKSPQLDWWDR